jgi:hypothetical protein
MLNLFLRHHLQHRSLSSSSRSQPPKQASAARGTAARPDFDLSDFEEPTPTMPGGYWHASAEQEDDAPALS